MSVQGEMKIRTWTYNELDVVSVNVVGSRRHLATVDRPATDSESERLESRY